MKTSLFNPLTAVTLLLLLSVLLTTNTVFAQVAINTDGSTADSKAMLDVKSTTKGMLIPRMSTSQRIAISNPPQGLMVYVTTDHKFYYYNGSAWTVMSAGSTSSIDDLSDGRTGVNSVFLGESSGANDNLLNNNNTAVGAHSFELSTSGKYNAAVGAYAMGNCSTGNDNTAVGYNTMNHVTVGTGNVAMGKYALFYNHTANCNVAIGTGSAYYNKRSNIVAVGDSALLNNCFPSYTADQGKWNTALGSKGLFTNRTGKGNTAAGYQVLYSNLNGSFNTATGYMALADNTGSQNTAFGAHSLQNNLSQSNLVAIGDSALFNNGVGAIYTYQACENTAVGTQSLVNNTKGYANTATGYKTLYANTTGHYNTALGHLPLEKNTTGSHNTAIGEYALNLNTFGSNNVAIGRSALYNNGSGVSGQEQAVYNTAVGDEALKSITTGSYNTALGQAAFKNGNYSNSTAIGSGATVSGNNATAIGHGANATANNRIRIGNTSVTYISGQVAWSYPSDGRFKRNITETISGLDFILKLRPVNYTWDITALDNFMGNPTPVTENEIASRSAAEKIVCTGFIAQEVEQAAQETGFDFDGVHHPTNDKDPYSLAYSEFVVPLVKAVQEQQQQIETLKQENRQMKDQENRMKKLEQANTELKARLDKLEKLIENAD